MMSEKELFLKEARQFLEPLWLKAHTGWGEIPVLVSSHMCRYTCMFLKKILADEFNEKWDISSGRPFNIQDEFGYKDAKDIWHDHSWLQNRNSYIDITADQFGGSQIAHGKLPQINYRANLKEEDIKESLATLENRVQEWIAAWYKK